jgi:two-component sensor histidine kinase
MLTRLNYRLRIRQVGEWLAGSPRLVVAGLIAAMVILGLLIARNSLSQSEARSRAQAEGDALLAINRLAVTMLDLETGQRGYILTGDPAYLAPYTAARREVDGQLEEVRLFVATMGSGQDEAQLRQLGAVVGSKLAELDRTVSLARSGYFDLAVQKVQASYGMRDMDQVRRNLAVLAARQSARRSEAFARSEAVEREQLPLILLMWLLILMFGWATLVSERRRAWTAAHAAQADVLRIAHEQTQLLAEELNHRVKNLFAVVLSVIKLSGRKQAPAGVVVEDISARIHALMQAHNAALERGGIEADLGEIVERTLAPYRGSGGAVVVISGESLLLSARNVTPVAMILHELATNAAKYGALSRPGGKLALNWTCVPDAEARQTVRIEWREDCAGAAEAAASEPAAGFGTRMTTMAAAQLGGSIERHWAPHGVVAVLVFPQG